MNEKRSAYRASRASKLVASTTLYVLLFTALKPPEVINNDSSSQFPPSAIPTFNPALTGAEGTSGTFIYPRFFSPGSLYDPMQDSLRIARQWYRDKEYENALSLALRIYNEHKLKNDGLANPEETLLIGQILRKIGNYKSSLVYYDELIRNPDIDSLDRIKHQITAVSLLFRLDKIDSALYHQKKIIQTIRNSPLNNTQEGKRLYAKSLINLSTAYFKAGKPNLSEYYSKLLLDNYKEYLDSLLVSILYNTLSTIYIQKKDYPRAKTYLLKSLSYLEKINNQAKRKEIAYWNLAWVSYLQKDYRAFEYAEKSFDIRDSLNNIKIKKSLSLIERKYNVEQERKRGEMLLTVEREKRAKYKLYLVLISLLVIMALIIIWATLNYYKEKNKEKFERIKKEHQEKIINATIDGKESERKMIAEVLHHGVSALLSSANLHLKALQKEIPESKQKEFKKTRQIVSEAAGQIRNLSHTLISTVLLKFGLKYAVQELVEKHSNQNLTFTCTCEDVERYPDDIELRIYHIIAELVNNIIKHSDATKGTIDVKQTDKELIIKVSDNGKGFNINKQIPGLGLTQIETRISQMNGTFKIFTTPNSGTSVHIHIPLSQINYLNNENTKYQPA